MSLFNLCRPIIHSPMPNNQIVLFSNWVPLFSLPGTAKKSTISTAVVLFCLINLSGLVSVANAEGSRTLVKNGGYRPYLEFTGQETAGINLQPSIKVFVKKGEQVNVGSSVPHSANGDADIVYRWPPGDPPLLTNDQVGEGSFNVDSTTCGFIDTVDKESVGPFPKPGGYIPCTFRAQTTGIYEIEFHAPEFANKKTDYPVVKTVTEPFPTDNKQHQTVAAWDVTVFQTPNDPSTEQIGRAYATFLPMDMGSNGLELNSRVFFLNRSGYLYRVNLNSIDPFRFIFFANSKGFQDKADETGNSIYRSVEIAEIDKNNKVFLHDPNDPDEQTDITHKIFFNIPATDLPLDVEVPLPSGETTWLRSTLPALPQINDFKFTGNEGSVGQTGTLPLKGNFSFTVDMKGDYIINIDANNNDIFGDGNDRVLMGRADVGENIIPWDGLDGSQKPLPAQTLSYNSLLTLIVGAMHFPFLDPENNPDGLIVERVNCDQLPCTVEDSTVFYNNSGLKIKSGSPPDPISALGGIDSSNGAQKFSKRFGDQKGIDTWTSLATQPVYLNGGLVLKQADISVSKTHDSLVPLTPGGPITYLIRVHNAGPSHIAGIQVQDSLPPTITDPFWTCVTTPSAVAPPAIQNHCAASDVEGPLNTTVDLQKDATATFTVEATISPTVAEGATIDNSVIVTRPKDVTNPFGDELDVKTETATHSVTLAPPTNQPPVAEDQSTTTSNTQSVLVPALSAQDPDGSVVSYTVFQLPSTNQGKLYLGDPGAGGTLITEGQKLTPAQISNLYFKPNPSFGGEVIFNYQAVDNQGSASNIAKVTITVTVPPPSVNTPPVADNKKLDQPVPNDMMVRLPALSGRDDDGEIISYTITTLPPSGTLYLDDPIKGKQPISIGFELIPNEVASIFFKPQLGISEQEVTFNYLVTDNQGAQSVPATVTIPVTGPNQPPVADDKTTPAIPNNTTIALPALTATDKDGTVESYKIMTIPPETQGIVYLGDPAKGGKPVLARQILTPEKIKILFFQPAKNFSGGDVKFTYTAIDNYDAISNTATVTVPVVAPPNQPPIANNDSANTNPDTPVTIPILNNDSDPDGDSNFKISITNQPPNGTVSINPDGTVTYKPNPGFANNTDTFTYQICDTGTPQLCDTATVTVKVSIQQLPPVAENLTASTILNNTVAQLPPLVANDPDGTVTIYTIETLPLVSQGTLYLGHPKQGGRLVNSGEQLTPDQIEQLFFQPDGNFVGKASFTYSATDDLGAISNQALVTIPVVAPVNLPPIANDDTDSTDPNIPVTIAILNNDNDPEHELDPSSVKIISPPPNGTVIVNPDGTVIYTPNPGFSSGNDVFGYEVCDAGTPPQCANAKVTISVPKPTNQPPIAENKTTPPSPNNVKLPLPSLSATDSDGTVTFYTIKTLPLSNQGVLYLDSPDEGFISVSLGSVLTPEQIKHLYFSPKLGFIGDASFTYTATDNQGAESNSALVTMPIIAAIINQPPIANDDSAVTDPDTPVIIPILKDDIDPEGNLDMGSIEIVTPPTNGIVVINPDNTVTYTPNPGFTMGIDTFVYEVCDLGSPVECDTATVKVKVPIDDPPPIADNKVAPATPNDQPVSLPPLSATDNGTVVSYTITTLPPANQGILYLGNPSNGATLVTLGQNLTPDQVGQLFFQPNLEFIDNASFTYTATDNVGGISSPALVTIPIIYPPNGRPEAIDDSATTEPNTPITIPILVNDKDPENNLDPNSVTITKQPTQGTVKINTDGTITYTPNPGVANVVDTLTYQVCDQAKPPQCDTAKVTITIGKAPDTEVPTNKPPIANDESTVTDPEKLVTINILKNDSDPEGQLDPSSVTIITPPQQGVVVKNIDGSVNYTPNPGFTAGTDTFVYQVCDKGAPSQSQPPQCDQATVTITVPIPRNLPPGAENKTAPPTPNSKSVQLPPLSATDKDGSVVSYKISTLPPPDQGTLYLGDPEAGGIPVTVGQELTPEQVSQLFFKPDPKFIGEASFTYTATDNAGATSSPALVTIPVIPSGEVDLTVTIRGDGIVTSEPSGINCNNSNQPCKHTYDYNTKVTLNPTADPGWEFEGWRGHCDNNDQVDMDGFKQCKAIFIGSDTPQFPLNVEPSAGGTVKTQPTGIDCGAKGNDCSEAYESGSMIDLIAEPEPGYRFVEWSGDCHGTSPTITVLMGQELNCKAIFSPDGELPVLSDDDGDGIASEIEDGAPNNGDGNNDGIPDSQQNNVVSLLTPEGKYLTIEERNGCTIENIKINQDSPEDGTYYSPALIDYVLSSCPEADIKIYYHDVSELGDQPLRQYTAAIPGDPGTMQWQDLPHLTKGTVLIDGKSVPFETFKLKDGELGDNTVVDGQILHTSGRVIEPGQIQLSSTDYSIKEGVGNTATVTVKRTGSCDGTVTVDYAIEGVTATVNADYIPVSGKLTWADGDCNDKVISIPIINDENSEDEEAAAIKLLNATGGAKIATPESTLTIIDDDQTTCSSCTSCGSTCTSGCSCCGASTCTNGCSCGCSSCSGDPIPLTMRTTIDVGKTVTITMGEGKGDWSIKEMPQKAFVSLESWNPLSTGVIEFNLKGISVGNTKMVIINSATTPSQTAIIYIEVVNEPSPIIIKTDLEIGQSLDMTVAGGDGELSISEIPDPNLVLLEDWTPLGDTGTATFRLTGVSRGSTKLVLSDRTSPQKIVVYITVGNKIPLPSSECKAIGMDSQGNPIDSLACFTGQIYLNGKLQANHRRLSHQEAQQVKVLARVQIDPAHVGQAADILTVGVHDTILNETKYTRDDQTWQNWDGQISSLPVAQYFPQLPETIEVFLYEGDLSGMPGEYRGYVGYRLQDNTIIYNGIEPINFFVGNSASIDMRGEPHKIPTSTDAYTTSFFESLVHNGRGKVGDHLIFDNEDQLVVSTFVQVEPQYVGRPADILMVAVHNTGLYQFEYTRTGPNWLGWDSRLESLSAAQYYHQLPALLEIPIYLGSLSQVPGEFTGYVGYRLPEGLIVFNGFMPIRVTIANGAGLTALGEKFPTTARFISWGYHDGRLGNPFDSAANQSLSLDTTIWVDSQHQGQVADIQMVGLCCQWTEQRQIWGQWLESQIRFQKTIPNVTLLPKLEKIHLDEKQLSPGEYTVYISYHLTNGDVIYNDAEPLRLKIW